jgi:hypothetical protein
VSTLTGVPTTPCQHSTAQHSTAQHDALSCTTTCMGQTEAAHAELPQQTTQSQHCSRCSSSVRACSPRVLQHFNSNLLSNRPRVETICCVPRGAKSLPHADDGQALCWAAVASHTTYCPCRASDAWESLDLAEKAWLGATRRADTQSYCHMETSQYAGT